MLTRARKTIIFLLIFFPFTLFAQSEEPASMELPSGFRGIEIGMNMDTIKDLLKKDPFFNYRGDPDVSLLLTDEQSLIECEGSSYIKRAFFQFNNEKLYIIIISLNPKKLDYYTLYSTLIKKYGETQSFSPSDAVWLSETVRFSLERPLTVKYIDRKVFESLRERGEAEDNLRDISKQEFLNQF